MEICITHECCRRLWRVGVTPVLEAMVLYPVVSLTGQEAAAVCLCEGYRTACEAFLAWAEGVPLEEAREAFASVDAATGTAAYIFDRRLLACRMEARVEEGEGEDARLVVSRLVTYGSRRGTVPMCRREAQDVFRVPELTLVRGKRFLGENTKISCNRERLMV